MSYRAAIPAAPIHEESHRSLDDRGRARHDALDVGPQVSPARLSGRTARAGQAPREARARTKGAGPAAPERLRTEDAKPDGRARGLPLRALRQPSGQRPSSPTAGAAAAAPTSTAASTACRSTPALAGNAHSRRLTARVTPKDERNLCAFFAPRTTVERQTSTAGPTERSPGIRRPLQVMARILLALP